MRARSSASEMRGLSSQQTRYVRYKLLETTQLGNYYWSTVIESVHRLTKLFAFSNDTRPELN